MKMRRNRKIIVLCLTIAMLVSLAAGCADRRSVSEQVDDYLNEEMASQTPTWENVQDQIEETTDSPEQKDAVMEDTASETIDGPEESNVEIELDWGDLEVDESVVASEESIETPEDELTEKREDKLQLVFLGDSIFDMARDGTGVPYLTSKAFDARIYNLAIGGISAALKKDDPTDYSKWDSTSVLGIAKAIQGVVSPDIMNGYHAREVFDRCDFSKTDYFIVECGTNDFLSQIPIDMNQGGTYKWYTYYGAVEAIINSLESAAPDAEIIFCTPHYERFYGKEHAWLGDVNSYDLGNGPLINYIAAGYNAADESNVHVINCYNELNINGYTAADYLLDGIHLNEEGRKLYAEMLIEHISRYEMEKGN